VLLSQSASPSVICLSSPRTINLGFLTEGKSAAIFITPSSWGSQRAGLPRIKHIFWRRCRGGSRRLLRGEFFVRTSFTLLLFCFTLFILPASFFIKKPKKIKIPSSCFYLSVFSFAEMANPENTKLCDFTSTNNSDFICTPIAPPAPTANFYEIKPALLNLVIKEQFSGASTEDAATHLNNFVELCEM
jgi:hypothetical protein